MNRNLLIKIGIGAAAAIAIFIIVRRAFAPEKMVMKKYGKFFNPAYISEAVKKVYAAEIETWTAKGARQDEVVFYIIRKLYPNRESLRQGADIIAQAKGTFSDDEEKALGVFAMLIDLPQLSYLALVWQRESEKGQKDTADLSWLVSGNPFWGDDTIEYTPMLPYLGTYFDRKHWSALLSILDKKPRKLVKKEIPVPSEIDLSIPALKTPKGAASAFASSGSSGRKKAVKKGSTKPKAKKI